MLGANKVVVVVVFVVSHDVNEIQFKKTFDPPEMLLS